MTIPTYANWYTDYSDDVEAALVAAFEQAAILIDPTMPQVEAHRLATEFAKAHAGDLLKLDGDISMAAVTRERVKGLVAQAIEQGQSLGQLQKNLRDDIVFSRDRAALTARTETAIAHGQGSREAAASSGRDMKRWTRNGTEPCDICDGNEGDGDIAFDEVFSSGDDTIPGHPACECQVRYFHRG
jgi:hypothetical protein